MTKKNLTLDIFFGEKADVKKQILKMEEVQGPYELPEGWKWVKLRDVLKEDRRTINP